MSCLDQALRALCLQVLPLADLILIMSGAVLSDSYRPQASVRV